jgi:hypothetical protein
VNDDDRGMPDEAYDELIAARADPKLRAEALAVAIAHEMRAAIKLGQFKVLQDALKAEGFYVEIRKPVKQALRKAGVL